MRTELRLFLTVLIVYGFYVTISSPINNVDGLCVAMVDHHTFEIDPRANSDYSELDGKKYSGYSPGASWLLVPFYFALKSLCVIAPRGLQFQFFTMLAGWLVSIPLAGLCVVGLYRALKHRQVSERAALITALAFMFGTMFFTYARRHNSYSYLAAALLFLSFCLVDAAIRSKRREILLLLGGVVAGFAVACDYKEVLTAFWIGICVLLMHKSIRPVVVFVLGTAPGIISILAYNWSVFGNPLFTPSKFQVARFASPSLQPGVIPLQGLYDFHWAYLCKLLVGTYTGFFIYMPVTALAIWGVVCARRYRIPESRALIVTTVGVFASHLLLASGLAWWWAAGDSQYSGPATRYLLPAVPFVCLFVGFAIERIKPVVTWVFVVLSISINWMFVLSANYGGGGSPIRPGWENLPLVFHARHIVGTFGAESVWFNFLVSSHGSFGHGGAAAITWCGAAMAGLLLWFVWRKPRSQRVGSTGRQRPDNGDATDH